MTWKKDPSKTSETEILKSENIFLQTWKCDDSNVFKLSNHCLWHVMDQKWKTPPLLVRVRSSSRVRPSSSLYLQTGLNLDIVDPGGRQDYFYVWTLYGLTSPFFAEAWLGDRLMMGRVLNLRGIQFFFICHILKTTLISQKGSPNRVEESLEETIVKTIFHTTYFGCALTWWIITANYKPSKTCLGWACIFNFGKT